MKHVSWWMAACLAVVVASCAPADRPGDAAAAAATRAGESGIAQGSTPDGTRIGAAGDGERVLSADVTRQSYSSGDYRWTPVKFQEGQALAATKRGDLVIPMPDGPPLALRYSRHVEHDDGNWTFIGKGANGEDAVITFGADAVFGSIQTRSGTVRLTTDSRGGWLVRSPPGSDADPARAGGTDMLVPPTFATLARLAPNLARGSLAGVLVKDEALVADATTVVDVVVGFTSGIVTARGSESAVRTRITNLVEVTNQAYANSGLPSRLRLAHAMPVDFPDATDNSDALSKLTGYKSGVGPVSVDPALQALRSAREQYHGDVVVLLRNFQTPENGGCGIAWLLGGGLSTISPSDDAFAFSIVADGTDVDSTDGKTYFCREETFAHELGHSMGQAHNIEDSGSPGTHPYSYGYRQAATNGFYTVMAYRIKDSTQFGIRHFANPAIVYNGAPTGVADTADNVRSLFQTMPVIANFRLATTAAPPVAPPVARRAPYDVNGDGRSDVFLRGDTALAYWAMNGTTRTFDSYLGTGGTGWRVVSFGDFDGAAGTDVLWANGSQMKIWFNIGGGSYVVYQMGSYGNGFEPFAAADVNGDGKSDILLRAGTAIAYWLLDGATVTGTAYAGDGGAGFRAVTTGDFNGDGADEIVWASATQIKMWVNGRSAGYNPVIVGTYANGYVPFAAGYVDGDSNLDLLFRNGTAISYWKLNGSTMVSNTYLGDGGAGYVPFAVGDYNGDGFSDIGWQNGATIKFWMNNGAGGYNSGIVGNYNCCYVPIGNL